MIQFNAPQPSESCFMDGRLPRLRHFACVEGEAGSLIRAMHAHEDYAEVVFICEGRGVHMIGDSVYYTGAGDLLFYDAGVPHDERPVPGGNLRYYCIGISALRLHGRLENTIMGKKYEPVMRAGDSAPRLESIGRMLHQEINRERLLSGDICRFLMLSFLLDVLEITRRNAVLAEQREPPLGVRIKRYIDAHYHENLTLSQISDALGVSQFHLARLFKERIGFSPMQYVINRRIGEAQTLLIATDEPIVRIAERVGYENPNYFSMLFKKNIGMTASQYRRNVGMFEEKDVAIRTT